MDDKDFQALKNNDWQHFASQEGKYSLAIKVYRNLYPELSEDQAIEILEEYWEKKSNGA